MGYKYKLKMQMDKISFEAKNGIFTRKTRMNLKNTCFVTQNLRQFVPDRLKEINNAQNEKITSNVEQKLFSFDWKCPNWPKKTTKIAKSDDLKSKLKDHLPVENVIQLSMNFIEKILNFQKMNRNEKKMGERCQIKENSSLKLQIEDSVKNYKIISEKNLFGPFQNEKTKINQEKVQNETPENLKQENNQFSEMRLDFSEQNYFKKIEDESEIDDKLFNLSVKSDENGSENAIVDSMILNYENGSNDLILLSGKSQSEFSL